MRESSTSPATVLWLQVSGLALIQGAIALLWVIYNLYLPQLLAEFGFPKALTASLLVIENLLAVGMEPLMGGLSDRTQRQVATRFPFIIIGVILASALFMSLPVIVLFGSPVGVWRWLLPAAAVAWALAMTVFRSPALSLLGRYAFASRLPQAASILTLMGALAGATGAFAQQFLLSLGPAIAFTAGSLVLLAAAATLRSLNPSATVSPASVDQVTVQTPVSFPLLGTTFVTGAGITLGFLVMRGMLSSAQVSGGLLLTTFTIAHLVTIIPTGLLAMRWGNYRAMLLGLGAMAVAFGALGILLNSPLNLILVIILGIGFSFVANAIIPFALAMVPPTRAGLGTGVYFGGASLAGSLFGTFASQLTSFPTMTRGVIGALAFGVAIGGVAIASKIPLQDKKLL